MRVDAAVGALSEWAYPLRGMWRFRRSPGGHHAEMGQRTTRCSVRASNPIRCIHGLRRRHDGTSPFWGRRYRSDGGWTAAHPTGSPRYSRCGDRKVHVIAISAAGHVNIANRRRACRPFTPMLLFLVKSGRTPHSCNGSRQACYLSSSQDRALARELRTSHKTVGEPLASPCQCLSNENGGTAPCKLPLKQTESGSQR